MDLLKTMTLAAFFLAASNVYAQKRPVDFEGIVQIHGNIVTATELAKGFAVQNADSYCFPAKSILATVWSVKQGTNRICARAGFYCDETDYSQVRCQRVGTSYAIRCCDDNGSCWIE